MIDEILKYLVCVVVLFVFSGMGAMMWSQAIAVWREK